MGFEWDFVGMNHGTHRDESLDFRHQRCLMSGVFEPSTVAGGKNLRPIQLSYFFTSPLYGPKYSVYIYIYVYIYISGWWFGPPL